VKLVTSTSHSGVNAVFCASWQRCRALGDPPALFANSDGSATYQLLAHACISTF